MGYVARHILCGKAARADLCGGRGEISVPTATDLRVAQSGSESLLRMSRNPPSPSVCRGLMLRKGAKHPGISLDKNWRSR